MTGLGGANESSMRWLSAQAPDYDNGFFTSLILVCLQGLDGNQKIVQRGVKFQKNQQSRDGSWNYWDRSSALAQKYPFPDDLDDTAYALLALSIYEPSYVDGGLLAKLAKLLIASELKPGGPYRTWLVPPLLYKDWGDVDLAVNANIGSLLAYQGVKTPGLEGYIAQQVNNGQLGSRYYVGNIPSLYFLSRWYQNIGLKKLVSQNLRQLDGKNDIETAMLLTAGCRLGAPPATLAKAARQLLDHRNEDHWPAVGLYLELTINNKPKYAGSPALTTAFALEALNLYQNTISKPKSKPVKPVKPKTNASQQIIKSSVGVPRKLRREYLKAAGGLIDNDQQGQIINMAGLASQVYGLNIEHQQLNHLNLASLNGWIAYSIYDDFYDDEAEAASLSVANYALRQTLHHFQMALPGNETFLALVNKTFDTIDTANQWEVQNARAHLKNGQFSYVLPNYGNYAKLAERSWGHMLAATGVLLASGHKISSPKVLNLQKFFYHYLIARQLNDDAHDWQQDLQKGHLSAVVTLLLKEYNPKGPLDLTRAD
jgi:hypothetical protein